ncbi:AMP-binding protein [Kaistella pullorum]|uniref:AMP-binding protein n=1 Tax=Kaistella pullorum TaxID=2763074 RepID=A0ABR8WK33_9FLAO|nr:AMP-binding protein [Kaistella pullorum]MBD8017111.1 AMP-binding protein [Kaistella pullorum]
MLLDFTQYPEKPFLRPETPFEIKVSDFLHDWFSEGETVPVQTSGSTGVPKIFDIEKKRMRASAAMTCDFLGLNPGDSALLCLPVEYISGKMMLVRAAVRKLELWVTNPTSNPLANFSEPVDFCAMSPLQVENSLDKLHLIKNLIIGGAQVSETLKQKIHKILHVSGAEVRIYETYGMSETLSHIAFKEIYPHAQTHFKIFEGVDLSLDNRGCLRIYAPTLNPEILNTNDLVELTTDSSFRFLGRIDNVINSGGLKIQPEVLESLVKKTINNDVLFLGLPDPKLGQKLVMAIEGPQVNVDSVLIDRVLNQIGRTYSKNQKPREIIFVDKFPRLPNGKIDRLTLQQDLSKSKY